MLALYEHPFSSYTWKALIALYSDRTPFKFRMVDADHPENVAVVQTAGPLGKFPVPVDDSRLIFEATSSIDYLARQYLGPEKLMPDEPDAALYTRMLDRVFDNYVMNTMQPVVEGYLRSSADPEMIRIQEARNRLLRSYQWLEDLLGSYPVTGEIDLIECAAAPSLFYPDWVQKIDDEFLRLKRWRAHLLALPPVRRCVDDARPIAGTSHPARLIGIE